MAAGNEAEDSLTVAAARSLFNPRIVFAILRSGEVYDDRPVAA
jgi:hypothetical protein